jgi:predicted dithiol-disulfide oxidoreductase (DUF899 family)
MQPQNTALSSRTILRFSHMTNGRKLTAPWKEKAQMKARDALVAERRRMPWMAIDANYKFDGPNGRVSLLDLFEGRRQLIVYRAFFEPEVHGWPDHACVGCSSPTRSPPIWRTLTLAT